jgi:hypothetical protein
MKRAFLDATFSQRERRWGRYVETTMWLVSATLLVALFAWANLPA